MALTLTSAIPLFQVYDLPASIAFYRSVLGFDLVAGDESLSVKDPDGFELCFISPVEPSRS
jgi:hypothetical protein